MEQQDEGSYVSRAGIKLAFALKHFGIDPAGMVCADLGSNVGGFVDCLLQHGASKVHAVDTAHGVLDWSLRKDPRVVVHERTNALDLVPDERVGLVTIDVGWTRQHLILPRAIEWLAPGGIIISLVKPHYEAERRSLRRGVLPDELAETVLAETVRRLGDLGIRVADTVESPIRGDGGNREFLALTQPSHVLEKSADQSASAGAGRGKLGIKPV